jgi:cytochrome b
VQSQGGKRLFQGHKQASLMKKVHEIVTNPAIFVIVLQVDKIIRSHETG